jgi:hypothetical protein
MFLKRLKNDKVLLCGNLNDLLTLKGNKCNLRVNNVKKGTSLHSILVENGVVNLSAKIELL